MFLSRFYPWAWADSVFSIDYDALYRLGYRGLLLDIDNTLVLHGADSTPEVDALFRRIHQAGLQTLLLSNNSEERIRRFMARIDSLYIAEAGKPAPAAYRQAVEMLGIRPEEALVIGDQIFTDIYGANRCGLASILVAFLRHPGERHFGKRRVAEAWILRCWRRFPDRRRLLPDNVLKKRGTSHAPEEA